MTPKQAFEKALIEGPSDKTRKAVLSDDSKYLYFVYCYAKYIDKHSKNDTRNTVLSDPHYAYYYAKDIDKYQRNNTRNATLSSPDYAYLYIKNIDKKLKIKTKKAIMFNDCNIKYNLNNCIKHINKKCYHCILI